MFKSPKFIVAAAVIPVLAIAALLFSYDEHRNQVAETPGMHASITDINPAR